MADSIEVRVPDIGDFEDVEIVEVLVQPGDTVAVEDSLVTLESDKASMEIPSPHAGVIESVAVAVGDKVSEGAVLLSLRAESALDAGSLERSDVSNEPAGPAALAQPMPRGPDESLRSSPPVHQPAGPAAAHRVPHASPLVRRKARELGIDLAHASASGPHDRVLEEDLKSHVRSVMSGEAGPAALPRVPEIDHERFGPTELLPLTRTRRSSGANLMRSWLNVPHVTQHDEADVSELEAFRLSRLERARERGLRLSPLHFVMKACVLALRRHPRFRSSLHPSGDSLIVKNYYHLGVAVDTEAGLVVPVVRDVDRKGLYELAAETAELAERARAHKLSPLEIQGACFTISSLGGIGGTAFTPIVNAPEVAVLGVSRMQIKPLWREAESGEGSFEPRKVLPLSLSYDHRAIDGADAARFTSELKRILEDPASLLL